MQTTGELEEKLNLKFPQRLDEDELGHLFGYLADQLRAEVGYKLVRENSGTVLPEAAVKPELGRLRVNKFGTLLNVSGHIAVIEEHNKQIQFNSDPHFFCNIDQPRTPDGSIGSIRFHERGGDLWKCFSESQKELIDRTREAVQNYFLEKARKGEAGPGYVRSPERPESDSIGYVEP